MKNGFVYSVVIFIFLLMPCACTSKSTSIAKRCPALVEIAESYNANGTQDGTMGVKSSVEYVDSVYRIIQIVDERIIPPENIKKFFGNIKQNNIAVISASFGSKRRIYQQMVNYRVTFEHVVKSKNTGKVIICNILTPNEISDALKKHLTPWEELKVNVSTLKEFLPREMDEAYTMNDISCRAGLVYIEILVDESVMSFEEVNKIKAWPKASQAVILSDQTTGLTFWSIAAKVPAEFDFHFVGSKGKNDLHIRLSKKEVIKYNELIDSIEQQSNN